MAALTKAFGRPRLGEVGRLLVVPIAANAVIYPGSMVAANATGYAVPASDTAALTALGVARVVEPGPDTTVNGVINPNGNSVRYVQVDYTGVYAFAVSAGTPVAFAPVFVVDDNTVSVSATTNNIPAGRLVQAAPGSSIWYLDPIV